LATLNAKGLRKLRYGEAPNVQRKWVLLRRASPEKAIETKALTMGVYEEEIYA